jgi:hypothetical protein
MFTVMRFQHKAQINNYLEIAKDDNFVSFSISNNNVINSISFKKEEL